VAGSAPGPPVPAAECLAAAATLAEEIWRRRVRAADGSVTWLRPGSPTRGEAPDRRSRLDPYLYDGTAGIALFFAALARAGGPEWFRDRALEVIEPVRRRFAGVLARPERAATLRLAVGGIAGVGSLLYAFARLGDLLLEPALRGEAWALTALFDRERIAGDRACDVLYGNAGAILALLALGSEVPGPGPRSGGRSPAAIATGCAERLLELQERSGGSRGGWHSLPGRPPMAGFSHGAAGVGSALLRLYRVSGDRRLPAAAREGLAFEAALCRPAGSAARPRLPATWCTGSAGIWMAWEGAGDLVAEAGGHARRALDALLASPPAEVDHLCCGGAGRLEALCRAGERGHARARAAARELAGGILRRAATGRLRWRAAPPPGHFDPTLFTGAAGVGYTLLRLAAPGRLPCVALLE